MQLARIAELLTPFLGPLSEDVLQSISTYIDILLRWNARVNLTAIRDPEQIVTRHFGESLFAARHLFPGVASVAPVVKSVDAPSLARQSIGAPSAKEVAGGSAALEGCVPFPKEEKLLATGAVSLADVGSGAGFPGLPIKLWAPTVALTLIESNHKKAAFLREITRAVTLTNVNIQTARAETLSPRTFDVVTLRAVERFESILPTAATLVARPGRIALLIGSTQLPKAQSLLSNPGLGLPPPDWSQTTPIPLSKARVLAIASYRDNCSSSQ